MDDDDDTCMSPLCIYAPCPRSSILQGEGNRRPRQELNRFNPKTSPGSRSKAWVPLFPAGVNPKEIPLTTKDLAREMGRKRTEEGRQEGKKGEKLVEWEGWEKIMRWCKRKEALLRPVTEMHVDSITCWKNQPITRSKHERGLHSNPTPEF